MRCPPQGLRFASMDPDDAGRDDAAAAFDELLGALEEFLAQCPAFEDVEFAAAINDAMQELDPEEFDLWGLMTEVLRALSADLFAQVLDAAERDVALHAALLAVDEEGASERFSGPSASGGLLRAVYAVRGYTPRRARTSCAARSRRSRSARTRSSSAARSRPRGKTRRRSSP